MKQGKKEMKNIGAEAIKTKTILEKLQSIMKV